jgi:hypothetical protein
MHSRLNAFVWSTKSPWKREITAIARWSFLPVPSIVKFGTTRVIAVKVFRDRFATILS